MIAIQDNLAARTAESAFRQRHLLPMSAPRTILRRIGRVDLHGCPAGACCLDEQQGEEQRPSRIADGLRQAAIVDHAVDFQVLNRQKAETVDDLAGCLVGEIQTPESNPFVETGNRLAPLGTFGRTLLDFAQASLGFGEHLFVATEEAGTVDALPAGEGSKGMQSHVDAGLFLALFEGLGHVDLAGKTSVPLAGGRALEGASFRLAFQRAMQDDLDSADFG
ncbi:MAG TPA: hypothetical protein VH575_05760 [Gemmataceae bacterium]|jgi:hypothetical protein